MHRLILTTLGVLALLIGAPPEASAAELVRPGVTPRTTVPALEANTGAVPRRDSWTDVAVGEHLTTGAPSAHADAPEAFVLGVSLPDAPCDGPPASVSLVLPDARAPPA